jgi:outer membrane receptor protein involved in Fe transport
MAYATVSSGFRPGGGNAVYPTTGAAWGAAFQQQNYTSGKWPATYEPDRVLSYELGEKARFLDRRLTVNTSIYYEDWRHVQLETATMSPFTEPTSTCSPISARDFSSKSQPAIYMNGWTGARTG